jgi:hypothetical protein
MTRSEALRLRGAMRDHLADLEPNYMFTFSFGYLIKPPNARREMTHFFNVVQKKAFGCDWTRQRDRDWPIAHGFPEHLNSNPHYHVLAKVDRTLGKFIEASGSDVWLKYVPRGQLDVRAVRSLTKAISYCTKCMHWPQLYEESFCYCDTRGW